MEITFLGGGPIIIRLSKFFLQKNLIKKINILTSYRQSSELVSNISFKNQIEKIQNEYDSSSIKLQIIKNLDDENYFEMVKNSNIVLSLGSAWIFKKRHIDSCEHLFNLHSTDLPRWRGGAPTSWRILSGINYSSVTLHKINEAIDDGDIVYSKKFIFPNECNTPAQYDKYTHEIAFEFLAEFIKNFEKNKDKLEFKPQQKEFSSYFPRLSSEIHGCINWDWKPIEIVRFVTAFDDPYSGAFTKISGTNQRVFLKKAKVIEGELNYHPFQSGLVFRKDHIGLYVCANGGAILISEILDEDKKIINHLIPEGTRLYSSLDDLEKSKSISIIYNSKGEKLKKYL